MVETAPSRSTCSTRTTSWPATARSSTRCAPRTYRRVRPPAARRGREFRRDRQGGGDALMAMGVRRISGLTRRPVEAVADPIHGVEMLTFARDPDHPSQPLDLDAPHETVAEFLAEHDLIVNCVLQDTDRPLVFVRRDELDLFEPGTLFVDVAVRRGDGLRVGATDDVLGADVRRRRGTLELRRSTTARRSCGTRRRGRSARR